MCSSDLELREGVVLVLDYGREGGLLRDPASRMAGTALAFAGHRATPDLLGDPGGRDLTAHVDLTLLREAAIQGGLRHLASTTQAAFLATAGVDDEVARSRSGPAATLEAAIALDAQRNRAFARRQATWFRSEPGIRWLEAAESPDRVAIDAVRGFLDALPVS